MIVGIDEVGRGAWAGPLVVGAVILGCEINGLTDSKMLTKKHREEFNKEISEKAKAIGLGWVTAREIDEIGLSASLKLATKRAVQEIQNVRVPFHEIIIDGTINFLQGSTLQDYVTTMKKADLLVPSVSAASIVAKVARDNFMAEQDAKFPGYNFKGHVGYGTAAHKTAIEQYGITPLHRKSFAPIIVHVDKNQRKSLQHTGLAVSSKLSMRKIGDTSETAATEELVRRKHQVIARNWKTKYCEIDIITRKDDTYYFVEVKHRKNFNSGDGLAAITFKKLNQMKFAAKFYAHAKKIDDFNLQLLAISTTGNPPQIESVVKIK